jgi:hypothetical protein
MAVCQGSAVNRSLTNKPLDASETATHVWRDP